MKPEIDFLIRVAVAAALGLAGYLIPQAIERRHRRKNSGEEPHAARAPHATHA